MTQQEILQEQVKQLEKLVELQKQNISALESEVTKLKAAPKEKVIEKVTEIRYVPQYPSYPYYPYQYPYYHGPHYPWSTFITCQSNSTLQTQQVGSTSNNITLPIGATSGFINVSSGSNTGLSASTLNLQDINGISSTVSAWNNNTTLTSTGANWLSDQGVETFISNTGHNGKL